ncbi:MAG: hypothetical protein IJU54_01965, partial [Alphaproteobacteria bacterium]|nr:hypothetical protein [Alphaproteobacteria bacterium]
MKIFSKVIAISAIIGCVSASEESVVFDLGASLCGNGKFGCKYMKGYTTRSDCSDDANKLAKKLSDISNNKMSADSGSVEYMPKSSMYSINSNGSNPLLFKLNGVENDGTLDRIVFNSSKKPLCAVQLGFENADKMQLPQVECNNVPLFKVNIDDSSSGGRIESFKTNTKTGLSYNVPIAIDGINCINARNDVCMIANKGTNNIMALDDGRITLAEDRYSVFPLIPNILEANGLEITGVSTKNGKFMSPSKIEQMHMSFVKWQTSDGNSKKEQEDIGKAC